LILERRITLVKAKKNIAFENYCSICYYFCKSDWFKEDVMKLNAPKKLTWLIALILGVLSLVSYFVAIPFVSLNLYWFMGAGWLLLILSTFLKGM